MIDEKGQPGPRRKPRPARAGLDATIPGMTDPGGDRPPPASGAKTFSEWLAGSEPRGHPAERMGAWVLRVAVGWVDWWRSPWAVRSPGLPR
jgi:hypothetical protein